MPRPTTPQPLTMTEAAIPIASLIILVALAFFLFGDAGALGPNQLALTAAALIATFIGWRRGHTLQSLGAAAKESVATGIDAVFILLAVGALIGSWAMSGTLVAMVYYGLHLLSPNYFYFTACALCAAVSFSIGSPWTVAGTIGVGFMGIAASMGLNPAVAAGAIISGAYFGGVSSPLSSAVNITVAVADVPLYPHIRESLVTSLMALVLALVFFFVLGEPGDFDATHKMDAIAAAFRVTPWLFLPLLVVIIMAGYKFPPFTTIMSGALAGGIMAAIIAPERVIAFADAPDVPGWLAIIKGVWLVLASGYTSTSGFAPMDELASRGGMDSMLDTIWLIVAALAFGGVVEKVGVLDKLITPIIARAKSAGALVAALTASSFATNVITADQFIAVVLPGRMFKAAFADRGLAPVVLSRSLGATAITTSPLIPWNSCGAYMAVTLGVAPWHYAPFAIFCIASPLIAVAIAFLGFRMHRTAPA